MAGNTELAHQAEHEEAVNAALRAMDAERILERIWAHDHTVWRPDPTEITNRLGWLQIADVMRESVDRLKTLADDVRAAGYTEALLLGMGGSSLAPEMFRKTLGVAKGYPDLSVLDSTDPGAVLFHAERLDPKKTLFIVATKSGGTVETLSLLKFFYNWMASHVGADRAGEHFIAITDGGSKLEDLADRHHFRGVFLNDPNIGGRYSALSYFGLVPAALIGVDVASLLARATEMAIHCAADVEAEDNPAAFIGAVLGELGKAGRDKVTFVAPPGLASFGDWVEQLIAESTGKEKTGILPVVGEPLGAPDAYGSDRLFVYLRQPDGGRALDGRVTALQAAGNPVVEERFYDRYDLGGQLFLWELAVAVAGHLLGINPFDQPNVEAAKVLAREMVAEYMGKGSLPEDAPQLTGHDILVYGDVAGNTPADALDRFLQQAGAGCYVALQAYVQPAAATDSALLALRTRIRDRWRVATTLGYGPRYLHSTGQLHKGDAGHGLFVQFTADDRRDVPIPDEIGQQASSITFGVLKAAQALGDRRALQKAGRRVIRFHLGADVVRGLEYLTAGL